MSLLLNAGNVKFKIISEINRIFRHNYEHFILINAEKNVLNLSEIIREPKSSGYRILALETENRRQEDEYFRQETLYRFCRDRNLKNLPVFVSLEEDFVRIKQLDFPKMPLKDMKRAIAWELSDWRENYVYNYSISSSEMNSRITVFLAEKNCLTDWQRIIKEQDLQSACIFYADGVFSGDADPKDINITFDDSEMFTVINECDRNKIRDVLHCLAMHGEVVLNKDFCSTTYLNWRNIGISVCLSLSICSSFIAGFFTYDYFCLKEQQTVLAQKLYLKQSDKDLISQLRQQEDIIKQKQNILKNVYQKDSLFYPLMINLSTHITNNIKLTEISVKDRQAKLKGRAVNYVALSEYKSQLEQIKFIKNIKIDDTKLNETDNLIEFTFYFNEVN